MKRIGLIGILWCICLTAGAQKFMQIHDKAFNFGASVGFNATFPVINSLTIDGTEAKDVRVQYKVGYLASVFCRVNIERFFIQPSLAWYDSEGEMYFNLPSPDGSVTNQSTDLETKDRLTIHTKSLEMPIMIGYSLVKEGPYGLSLMVGPKFKYNYKVKYTSNFSDSRHEYTSESTPWGVNIRTGVGVSIWRLFFDFVYEFGLNQVESDFKDKSPSATHHDIRIDKRTNVMSFSLGFLF